MELTRQLFKSHSIAITTKGLYIWAENPTTKTVIINTSIIDFGSPVSYEGAIIKNNPPLLVSVSS